MKKQILFMMFLSLAFVFAGVKSYGQFVDQDYLDAAINTCPVPVELNCNVGDALTPSPGEVYQYDIAVSGTGTKIHWFVTTDLNVIASATLTSSIEEPGGTYILTAGTTTLTGSNATYNNNTNTGDVLEIAWNYFNPTTTVLLVAFAIDADGCTNNIDVYKIEPVFNFILDVFALEDNGVIQDASDVLECVSPVQSATYDDGTSTLTVDYGDNYIFYIVSAANWVHSWDVSFVAPSSTGGSSVGTVEWTYADMAHQDTATWWTDATHVYASRWGVSSVGENGRCIVVRVNIDHGSLNELVAAETYTLGVNGVMYSSITSDYPAALADLNEDPADTDNCINTLTDEADYIISPRPDITDEDPTPFETKVPSATP